MENQDGVEMDKIAKKICSVEKQETGYVLKDYNGDEISQDIKNNIKGALSTKTRKYTDEYENEDGYASDSPTVWVLKIQNKETGKCYYKNIASCKRIRNAFKEINEHIYQLVKYKDKEKAKKYFGLWDEGINEIEFLEININQFIESIKKNEWDSVDPYIKALIMPDDNVEETWSKRILMMNRAAFVEGKLASDYNMKKEGIWAPSGGMDGMIYDYYEHKKRG